MDFFLIIGFILFQFSYVRMVPPKKTEDGVIEIEYNSNDSEPE